MVISLKFVFLISQLLTIAFAHNSSIVNIGHDKIKVFEKEKIKVNFTINWKNVKNIHHYSDFNFNVETERSDVASVLEGQHILNRDNAVSEITNISVILLGKQLGFTRLQYSFISVNNDEIISEGSYLVGVIQSDTKIRIAFTIVMSILVMINNINMGCQLDLNVIKNALKRPIAVAIGFFSQFLFMPLGSYAFGLLFFPESPSWRLGLLTLGCSPGGAGSNFWTLLFHGDVDLSVTMTLFSTIAAIAMMPFWLFTLGNSLFEGAEIKVPYFNMTMSLMALMIPLAIGIWLSRNVPSVAKKCKGALRPFTIILLLIAVSGGLYVSWYVFKLFTWNIVYAGMCVAWGGYLFGAIAAKIAGLKTKEIIAVSIETALQNPGVAFVLLQLSLPQPDCDLATVPIVSQLLLTGPPLWGMYMVYVIGKKCKEKKDLNENNINNDIAKVSETYKKQEMLSSV